ncbi:hypothetical protein, partial [Desulfonatronospira sp.]|uniref:hypothetical protein n=1 Tax=Desulfonatronospira sp. TaxID=1962951 RepID=UPI0025BAF49C
RSLSRETVPWDSPKGVSLGRISLGVICLPRKISSHFTGVGKKLFSYLGCGQKPASVKSVV